ncbi:PhnE/PtxC family ABC transporter permease [Dellaglioa sp. L3N]
MTELTTTQHLSQPQRHKPIQVHPWNRRRSVTVVVASLLIVATVISLLTMSTGNIKFSAATVSFFKNLGLIFLQPGLNGTDSFGSLLSALATSVALAILTTLIGAIISFVIALFAARNLSNPIISTIIRVVMATIRAVPTILWALIFSIVIGLGATAAVIGLSFHSIAYLTKAYSESIEELDDDALDALKVSGASWWQIVFQAVIPATIPMLLSWTFIRFEMNFTNAVAVGAAAGAGGIGYQLFMSSGFYFDFHEIGVIIYLCLIVAGIFEYISLKLRSNYLVRK